MPENLELLRKSPGAHRGVATKLYNEADGIMNKPFYTSQWRQPYPTAADSWIIEEEAGLLIWAEPKSSVSFYWSRQLERWNCWDRGVWRQDMAKHRLCSSVFVQQKTRHSSQKRSFAAGEHHDFEKYPEHQSAEAQVAQFFRKLLGLDLVFRSLQGSSNR